MSTPQKAIDDAASAILEEFRASDTPLALSELSSRTGIPLDTVRVVIRAMHEDYDVKNTGDGWEVS